MRINKLLSNYGICSRKEANRIIEEERIIVNGKLAFKGQWVEESDEILLDDKPLKKKKSIYIAFNKPRGIECTAERENKNNIIDFINYGDYIFPIGRLDKDSEGLILLTNDGDLASLILEADNYHEKEYIVTLNEKYDDKFLKKMSEGIEILGVKTRRCIVEGINDFTYKIILTQGLNRQIRRMSKALGYNVTDLKRVRILNIIVDGIKEGEWRYLTEEEVEVMKKLASRKSEQ